MAKVQDLKKGLGTLMKKPILGKKKTDNIIKSVHKGESDIEQGRGRPKTNFEKTIRYTIDIPEPLYKRIKHRVVDEGTTMKAFLVDIIENNLNKA
jgi:predicted DNA binding CopG/RHH family protein